MSAARIEGGTALSLRPADAVRDDVRATPTSPATAIDGPDFASVLSQGVEQANQAQRVALEKADALARGATDDLHGTMISMKEADISMKLVGTVRNKLLDAFHELWRINL
jgi:flagellar hook-basal body complex protein FliE